MASVSIGSLVLESNQVLHGASLAYERVGKKDAPAILVCHALTGDQHSVGTEERPGWWAGLIGPGKAVDTNVFQVITFNVLGGCNGSTGPQSVNPETGEPYRASFPLLTIRDMVRAERAALERLGVSHLAAVIGGSLGGMKTLEWGHLYPDFVDIIFPLAVTPAYSDYGIAFNHIGIQAIEGDAEFKGGNYEDSARLNGFHVARMAGMVTYRSSQLFNRRFSREHNGSQFDVESYLSYQGKKLAERFDANSYITLLKAMNTHDVRKAGIETEVFSLSYSHDLLYPQELMAPWLDSLPKAAWQLVETDFGHDGFLVEFEKWGGHIQTKLNQLFVSQPAG
ncbi:homoserine O-acetyltransferase [Planomicrobium sp. CPCC 101110]|uniref:homoserine O-acetyltransferase MetX n=1 Tax=Planomicrobium sp. CPCC 101110 TaxID=2599619 RepID=UPI0011B49B2B|nr:homoserine O-acetyltransferase [Planomicrobium sp. CPCC 101110]TWT27532.1 homoserine O-acetyltransferase [Planomicrobium sp. CPCC 101110]